MGFIDNIKQSLGADLPIEPIYRAVIFGENCAYFENVKTIVSYDENLIILALKKGGLEVSGEKLYIKRYSGSDLIVCGKILAVVRK